MPEFCIALKRQEQPLADDLCNRVAHCRPNSIPHIQSRLGDPEANPLPEHRRKSEVRRRPSSLPRHGPCASRNLQFGIGRCCVRVSGGVSEARGGLRPLFGAETEGARRLPSSRCSEVAGIDLVHVL